MSRIIYLFWIFQLLVFSVVSCKSDKATLSNNKGGLENRVDKSGLERFENQFFTLNFEKGSVDLEDFNKHFFSTFPHNDPTQGDVVYDQKLWKSDSMIEMKDADGLYAYTRFREDSKGYDSYRFTTKSYYNLDEETQKILFVFKGELPSNSGMWPAWWLNGSNQDQWIYQDNLPAITDSLLHRYSGKGTCYDTPSAVNNTDWPAAGEIDIIENINGNRYIHNTIHTCPQMCDSEWNDSGEIINCANAIPYQDMNKGCSGDLYEVESPKGTFACLWEKNMISFYYWLPGTEVSNEGGPLDGHPNPKLWEKEALKNRVKLMESDTPCDKNLHQPWQCKNCEDSNVCQFSNMKMIFNATLCGVWAGNEFDSTSNSLNNCRDYIMGGGVDEIDGTYMKVDYVAVQKLGKSR